MSHFSSGNVSRFLILMTLFTFTFQKNSFAYTEQDTIIPPAEHTIIPPAEHTIIPPGAHPINANHLLRGERLFYGLVYFGEKSVSCAACHNTRLTDTLNWNPDALEVSLLYLDKSTEDLGAVLLNPRGKKITEAHAGIDLSGDDLIMLKAYMDNFAKTGMKKSKPVFNNLILFVLFISLILLSLVDLILLKKLKAKWVHLIIILFSLYWVSDTLVREAIAIGRSQYYAPDQPIKFSHQVHSDGNQTECIYCHTTAEYAHSAGIPSVNHCMNCHIIVREGTNSGRFEINKIVEAYENKQPVRWIMVHSLPDHAFFSHAQHVGVAGLDCAECHGEVKEMHKMMQVNDLSMGWCLDCHRTNEVDIFNNEFYSDFIQLREDVKSGKIETVTARETGGTDCMKCHY